MQLRLDSRKYLTRHSSIAQRRTLHAKSSQQKQLAAHLIVQSAPLYVRSATMSSKRSDTCGSIDSSFAQPDTTNVSKPVFTPNPLRARKKFYDPVLTAGMRPLDTDMATASSSVEATKERVLTEQDETLRSEAVKLLAAKLSRFRKLSPPHAAIMQRQPEVFAEQWESAIWGRSMQSSDRKKYDDEVRSTLRLLTKCDKKWSEAWPEIGRAHV